MQKHAVMVYIQKNDKLLFLVRNKKDEKTHLQGIYLPMGGHVEPGERIEECAKREVFEESGIKVQSLEFKGIVHGMSEDDWVHFLFLCKDFEGEPAAGNEGTFEWVDIKDITSLHTYENQKNFMRDLFKYNFFVAEIRSQNFKSLEYNILRAY